MKQKLIIAATITLLLREQDLKLLIRALQKYIPVDENEAQEHAYLQELLETIDQSN